MCIIHLDGIISRVKVMSLNIYCMFFHVLATDFLASINLQDCSPYIAVLRLPLTCSSSTILEAVLCQKKLSKQFHLSEVTPQFGFDPPQHLIMPRRPDYLANVQLGRQKILVKRWRKDPIGTWSYFWPNFWLQFENWDPKHFGLS